jgi:hypothetical protein
VPLNRPNPAIPKLKKWVFEAKVKITFSRYPLPLKKRNFLYKTCSPNWIIFERLGFFPGFSAPTRERKLVPPFESVGGLEESGKTKDFINDYLNPNGLQGMVKLLQRLIGQDRVDPFTGEFGSGCRRAFSHSEI